MEFSKLISTLSQTDPPAPDLTPGSCGEISPDEAAGMLPDLVLREIRAEWLDRDFCCRLLLDLCRPEGPYCTRCGARQEGDAARRYYLGRLAWCSACGRRYNPWRGTPLDNRTLGPCGLVLAALLVAKGTTTAELAQALGCSDPTARAWRRRLGRLREPQDPAR
jgi:hypothetical protein